jgi:hypothetical protein
MVRSAIEPVLAMQPEDIVRHAASCKDWLFFLCNKLFILFTLFIWCDTVFLVWLAL